MWLLLHLCIMHRMETREQYARCLVLAGGGFRFAYYLGVHAAAEDCGRRPDLLLGTCGGAIAAAVIAGLPDAPARLDWIASTPMHRFLRAIRPGVNAALPQVLGGAAWRWITGAAAQRVPDLFDDYLFELPEVLPLPQARLPDAPALAIVGGRLLFGPEDVGARRGARTLFEEVVFGPQRVASLLAGHAAPAADPRWSSGAIAPHLQTDTMMPVDDAVRISVADMFYFPSHVSAGRRYTGGVIDLFPIELAQALAREVIMERKSPFNPWLALPALRAVLGLDGAARLQHVHAQQAAAWVDTRDVGRDLRAHGIGKRIDWRANRIGLDVPESHDAYVAQVRMQWDYGYRKGMAALEKTQQ